MTCAWHDVVCSASGGACAPDTSPSLTTLDPTQVTLEAAALRTKFQGRKVVLGIDRLERIRGIPLKLLAFERFLQKHPEWRGKVVLVQVRVLCLWVMCTVDFD